MHTQIQPYFCALVSKIASALRNNHGAVKCCLLALVFLAPLQMWGQAVGAIVGTVADPSGAVIPNARITAANVATGVSQSTVTSGAGTYTIPNLVVGTYTVTAEGPGFKTAIV